MNRKLTKFIYCSVVHEDYEATDVLINSDGSLFWVPPVTSHTLCEGLDLTYWPWDFQDCAIIIGSWTKSGWQLDPVLMGHSKENVSDYSSSSFLKRSVFHYLHCKKRLGNQFILSRIGNLQLPK